LSSVFAGVPGGVGAALGAVLVLASGFLGLWVMRRTADALPVVVMAGAVFTYLGKFAVFLVLLLVFRQTTLFDVRLFAYTLLAGVVVWTAGEAVGFLRSKVPTVGGSH
jgi:ATP synthase protein I